MKKYALIIDEYGCWGCKACQVACKQEKRQPDGINYIYAVEDGPKRVDGKLDFIFRVNVCKQCDSPPCAEACPEGAFIKDSRTGIVRIDTDKCTGCKCCLQACPYDAIRFDEERSIALKCDLCFDRVEHGLYPACADNVCLAHCIYFGDAKEIETLRRKNREKRVDGSK